MTEVPQAFYTPDQVATLLQVNVITIHRWLRSGELIGYKLGRKLRRISPEQLESFLERKLGREVTKCANP